jgi:arylsulfatase A-like enzyme/Tfp pilus assembly protein PilF
LAVGAASLLFLAGVAFIVWPWPPRLNLLFITIDTLRADHVGSYGYAAASTPALDGLAARGARFANAQAAVPLTGPSHATIFTGTYPPVHGVRDNVVFSLDARHTTLATLLKRRGYRTAAFAAAYPVAAAFGLSQGFDEFHEGFHEIPVPGQGAERPGNEVADEVVAWLEKPRPGPFFVWAHLYDPHAPYTPPPPYRERFADRLYDGEIAFADAQVGRILESLKAAGRERDTLVVAMADHGESLGDHNEQTHAILIYGAVLHIPLILAGPGVPAGRVVEARVGAVDVLPTVLHLLGASVPDGLAGRDLTPAFEGRRVSAQPLYAESLFGRLNCRWSSLRAVTLEDWKLIQGAESELYNLADDPHEARDRSADDPERAAKLRTLLAVALQKMAPGGDSARTASISSEQEERLRSLGYTAGSGGSGSLDQPDLPDPRTHVRLYERVQALTLASGPAADRAIGELIAITGADPGNPHAHYTLGNMAYRHGRLGLAEKALARTMELDPDRPGMRLTYGHLLRDLGRLTQSEHQLRIAVEQTTADDVRTRASLAETLIAEGKLDETESMLRAAQALEPNHLDVLRALGLLRVKQGRAAEGIPYLEKAGAGRDPEPWIEVARVRLDQGDPLAALSAVQQALSRNPGHPWALAVDGHALVLSGRRAEGLETLRRAVVAGPRRPEVWLSLAQAFEAAGDARQAAACRRDATAIAQD